MVDTEKWGTKRLCQSCQARFYDMKKNPIICPKCGKEYKLEDSKILKEDLVKKTSIDETEKEGDLIDHSDDFLENVDDLNDDDDLDDMISVDNEDS